MIGRLLKGIFLGLFIGGLAAAALIKGLGVTGFDAEHFDFLAYAVALGTGAVAGLIAGKPIWADGAGIEAILKTVFGALLGAGGMFLLQKFHGPDIDLTKFGLGSGALGHLTVVALPAIATLLSVFFEVDNTDGDKAPEKGGRVAGKAAAPKLRAPSASVRAGSVDTDADEAPAASKKAQK
jgi:hypothetical protein